jgi:hypothetical protein
MRPFGMCSPTMHYHCHEPSPEHANTMLFDLQDSKLNKPLFKLGMVVYTCNPSSYLGGRDRRITVQVQPV